VGDMGFVERMLMAQRVMERSCHHIGQIILVLFLFLMLPLMLVVAQEATIAGLDAQRRLYLRVMVVLDFGIVSIDAWKKMKIAGDLK